MGTVAETTALPFRTSKSGEMTSKGFTSQPIRAHNTPNTDSALRAEADFSNIVHALNDRKGRLIVTGMGKSGLIGQKIAATMSSIGLPTVYMHAAEAIHGDIGLISKNDIIINNKNSFDFFDIQKVLFFLSYN